MFGVKNIMSIVLVYFVSQNSNFGNILTQKYQTYLPVCACSECPPWAMDPVTKEERCPPNERLSLCSHRYQVLSLSTTDILLVLQFKIIEFRAYTFWNLTSWKSTENEMTKE